MAERPSFDDALDASPLVVVLRRCSMEQIEFVATAVRGSWLRLIEVTVDTEGWAEQVAHLQRELTNCVIGVGSVLTVQHAHAAIDAGAGFVVAPITDVEVIRLCVDQGVPVVPGASSPTEIADAIKAGTDLVKIFPVSLLGGVKYLDAVLPPLHDPAVLVSGGVDLANAGDFLAHGARALAVGGALWEPHLSNRDHEGLRAALTEWSVVGTRAVEQPSGLLT